MSSHNENCISSLGQKIALLRASHTENGRKFDSDKFRGLEGLMYISVDSKVLLTSNLNTSVGLNNGSVGIVKDIVFKPGVSPPELPFFIWVDFGAAYTGESFFGDDEGRKGWFPIKPVTFCHSTFNATTDKVVNHSRTMVPLRLSWAWTIWKSQGMTIKGKVVIDIGKQEREHGISYVAFSRATTLDNIGLIRGISLNRLTNQIKNNAKMAPRILEETRLEEQSNVTKSMYEVLRNSFPITTY